MPMLPQKSIQEHSDPVDAALEWHGGDARETIRTLLMDSGYLRSQLAIAGAHLSRGIMRGLRSQGYALIDQELELGLCSIAVPLRGRRGEVVAALNVGAPAAHVQPQEMVRSFLPLLLEFAGKIQLSMV